MGRPATLPKELRANRKGEMRLVTVGHLPKKWLTFEETEKILAIAAKLNARDFAILKLYSYGLRRSEVVGSDTLPGIRRKDVNLAAGTIWIRGKGDPDSVVKDREVPFPDDAMRIIAPLLREAPEPESKLFDVDETTIWRHLKLYAKEAGMQDWEKVHPHRLRAFFGSDAKWRQGLSDLEVRDLMRHKSVVMTQQYTGVMPPELLAQKMRQISRGRQDT